MEVGSIDSSMVGDVVSSAGRVSNFSRYEGNIFFQLVSGNRSIKVVRFDSEKTLEESERVRVEGEVAIYRGELEIIADSVKRQ